MSSPEVGLYKLNPVDPTHSLKAPGFFNPCAYQVKTWFQYLLSQMQLVPLHHALATMPPAQAAVLLHNLVGRLHKLSSAVP
jgi:hypothetical protein